VRLGAGRLVLSAAGVVPRCCLGVMCQCVMGTADLVPVRGSYSSTSTAVLITGLSAQTRPRRAHTCTPALCTHTFSKSQRKWVELWAVELAKYLCTTYNTDNTSIVYNLNTHVLTACRLLLFATLNTSIQEFRKYQVFLNYYYYVCMTRVPGRLVHADC
jgi:hypothetical protein